MAIPNPTRVAASQKLHKLAEQERRQREFERGLCHRRRLPLLKRPRFIQIRMSIAQLGVRSEERESRGVSPRPRRGAQPATPWTILRTDAVNRGYLPLPTKSEVDEGG